MTSARVKGHTLVAEGAPFDVHGERIVGLWASTDGPGAAKCSCGEQSEHLPSRSKRRAWHRAHKATVLEEQS